jgi:hypothetical protein
MLYKPLDVIVSKSNEIYVSVTQGITKINLNNQKCQQVRPPPIFSILLKAIILELSLSGGAGGGQFLEF